MKILQLPLLRFMVLQSQRKVTKISKSMLSLQAQIPAKMKSLMILVALLMKIPIIVLP
jgi:hypothetical protein